MNKELTEIAEHRRITLVYLFGSRVKGKVGDLSDYDVAVLVDGGVPYQFKYQLAYELRNALNTERVDLVILNSAPIELAYNIISTGRLIYQRSVYDRVEFEANTMSKYFDYLPVLRRQREEILKESNYERRIQRGREALRQAERMLREIRASKGKKT
ncbi:MAG: nucleotidyltransferase domain-containing protein [Candidatus Latescibacteria bacterium]|nr:nucleotidyltransferase domain-containing protein [Candidatus Latescibacterota bacterium]